MTEVSQKDRTALLDLVHRNAVACDTRDRELFRSLWWHGATLEVHREGPNRAATSIVRAPDDLDGVIDRLETHFRNLHVVTNHVVTPTDDEDVMVGAALCTAHHVRLHDPAAGEGPATDRVMTIRYADRYRRANHHWRFERRAVHLLWTHDVEVLATP